MRPVGFLQLVLLQILILSLLQACAQRGPLPPLSETSEDRSSKVEDRDIEFQSEESREERVPEIRKPPVLGLILSAGGARALAHAGLLKAFEEQRIKVKAIVGHEWGALPAALFADLGRSHQVDWGLFKLKQDDWGSNSLFKKLLKSKTETLKNYLNSSLPRRSIEDFEIPFACPTINIQTGQVVFRDQGQPDKVVLDCMALTPTLELRSWSASPWAIEASADWLRRQGANVIFLINVIEGGRLWDKNQTPDPQVALQWQELRHRVRGPFDDIEVQSLQLKEFHLNQFSAKNQIIKKGYAQGLEMARELIENRGF